MHLRHPLTLIICLLLGAAGYAQNDFRRDSIYTDRGIPNTLDFEPQSRIYFEAYLPNGRPGEIVTARQNEFGEWAPAQRRLFTYQGGEITQILIQSRSADGEEWLDERQRSYGYDGQGRMIARRIEVAPAPGSPLVNDSRRLYAYNDADEITEIFFQQWENDDWQPVRRQQFTYNPQGETEQRILQTFLNDDWQNVGRRLWTYGADGFSPAEVTTQRWDDALEDWANTTRRQMAYNAAGFWIGSVDQVWNETAQAWENQYREIHPFSGQGQLDSYLYQFWNGEEWVNGVRETTFQNGLNFGNIVEQWDTLDASWERQFRYQTTLNNDGLVAETLDRQYWDSDAAEWVNQLSTLRRTHFWSEVMVGVQDTPPPRACTVPNPYRKGQVFNCPDLPLSADYTLELADVTGRPVWRQLVSGGNSLTLSGHFPPGTYLLRIADASQVYHLQKLVVID